MNDYLEQDKFNRNLVDALLKQQRKELRWKIIRFFLLLGISLLFIGAYIQAIHGMMQDDIAQNGEGYVALVRINGAIGPDEQASAKNVNPALVRAFQDKQAKGVVISINSPGGTPVQSAMIRDRIQQLRQEFPEKRVVVVGEDMLTSGAYMIATGSDEIYVNRSTLTGSIGVVIRGFGFKEAADKLGVERRVYTAGNNKNRLDPFEPVSEADMVKVEGLLTKVHRHFIDYVKEARGSKLKGDDESLFSGDFWTGEEAFSLGLVDGLKDLSTVLREEFDVKQVKDYTADKNFLEKFASELGASVAAPFQFKESLQLRSELSLQ